MHSRLRPVAMAAAVLIAGAVAQPDPAAATPTGRSGPAERAAAPAGGRGTAARPYTVDLSGRRATFVSGPATVPATVPAPLGRDGRPVRLPVRPSRGRKVR
ncbi:MAG TPA: hypothetical protein VFX70_23445, partial [Mycobacteriales bacterium]|nr:hypothetical protein [Mycobacteriales bacterium]